MALATLHARDPLSLERHFQYLTPPALQALEADLATAVPAVAERDALLAVAVVRRTVHKCLHGKYANLYNNKVMEEALHYHTLPGTLQQQLQERHNSHVAPTTWWEALEQLRTIAKGDACQLWRLLLDHPMTEYVMMQCQDCGHVIPDDAKDEDDDAAVGLSELEPAGDELGLRGGWFRGRPRGANLLALHCPSCGSSTTVWYRSAHPQVILNPHRWGRLCGEQEDLRLQLANYLNIPLRLCLPLDWDHVWSEFYDETSNNNNNNSPRASGWQVHDDSARNFAARLDEGMGAWTRVWVIHPDPQLCQDVTDDYLSCLSQGGRADDRRAGDMERYVRTVETARVDATGDATQAKTVNGYVLERAKFDAQRITQELQKAAKDYGIRAWWEIE